MRSESRFDVQLRVMRCVLVLLVDYSDVLVTEAEVFLTMLLKIADGKVSAGAIVADAAAGSAAASDSRRYGTAGARILANTHRMLARTSTAPTLSEISDHIGDIGPGMTRDRGESLTAVDAAPPLFLRMLVLEMLHILTLKRHVVRGVFQAFDSTDGCTNVGCSVHRWVGVLQLPSPLSLSRHCPGH